MKIRLAGFNVDTDLFKLWNPPHDVPLTPETLSAAYARISRSPLDIPQLRKQACRDVVRARKSNQTIIFEMGHHSVAEHAVFNLDIMGVSRLALEEIERFRLASFTEKSQRYVTLKGDFVIPDEIRDPRLRETFTGTVELQNDFYRRCFERLREDRFGRHPELAVRSSSRRLMEGWANEDARYILSLATAGQVGVTINARNLEHLFRRFSLSPLEEVRKLGRKIFALIEPVAPSLILFPRPSAFDAGTYSEIKRMLKPEAEVDEPSLGEKPELVQWPENGDDIILASFLCLIRSIPFPVALRTIRRMKIGEKEGIFRSIFGRMEFFDVPPREFEMADVLFQAKVSAACYAQLKRHRMSTVLAGPYRLELGNVIPGPISRLGLGGEFRRILKRTHRVHQELKEEYGDAADYILTNSHRRTALVKMNLRELYHFIRLRDDEHAQWDIRNLAHGVLAQVREKMPLASMLLCGKSQFGAEFERTFRKRPKYPV